MDEPRIKRDTLVQLVHYRRVPLPLGLPFLVLEQGTDLDCGEVLIVTVDAKVGADAALFVDHAAMPHQAVMHKQLVKRRCVLDVVGTAQAAGELPSRVREPLVRGVDPFPCDGGLRPRGFEVEVHLRLGPAEPPAARDRWLGKDDRAGHNSTP